MLTCLLLEGGGLTTASSAVKDTILSGGLKSPEELKKLAIGYQKLLTLLETIKA